MKLTDNLVSASLTARIANKLEVNIGSSVQKLSSGTRVNSAKDGAADLGISQNIQRSLGALNSARKNALDAISMAQTAESGVEQGLEILGRMQALLSRSPGNSLSKVERASISSEITSLAAEIDQISNRTQYNGNRLLSGNFSYVKSGEFVQHTGRVTTGTMAALANSDVHVSGTSFSDLDGASVISLASLQTSAAQNGDYQITNDGDVVTLTRTLADGSSKSESITLVADSPTNDSEYQVPTSEGDLFGIEFKELGVSLSFQVDSLGTLTNPEDWAALISSIGQEPRAPGWTSVSNANWATPGSDTVTAVITSTGGNLKITETSGLSAVSGYPAAATWTDGTSPEIAFLGTADQVNAALATLKVESTTGLGQITVAIAPQFGNAGFSDTTPIATNAGPSGTRDEIPGWYIYKERAILGQTVIAGFTSPTDTARPGLAPSEDATTVNRATYAYGFPDSGANSGSLWLHVDNVNIQSYGVLHGPYLVSKDAIEIEAGDTVTFRWRSQNGGDDYDSYAYLQEVNTGVQINLLNSTGSSTEWANKSVDVTTTGSYKFVFLAGTFDRTGGNAAGGSLYVDDIQVTSATPKPGTVKTVNIGSGGSFSVDSPLVISSITRENSMPGEYRLVGDLENGEVTLKRYDSITGELQRSESIKVDLIGSKEQATLDFQSMGITLKIQNQADFAVRLGDEYSGFDEEIVVVESEKDALVLNETPLFQTGGNVPVTNSVGFFTDIAITGNVSTDKQGAAFELSEVISNIEADADWISSNYSQASVAVERFISALEGQRSAIGAFHNRMESAINVLNGHSTSIESAHQNVVSVDYASETANLLRAQLTAQTSTAMQAQLNMVPNLILTLIE